MLCFERLLPPKGTKLFPVGFYSVLGTGIIWGRNNHSSIRLHVRQPILTLCSPSVAWVEDSPWFVRQLSCNKENKNKSVGYWRMYQHCVKSLFQSLESACCSPWRTNFLQHMIFKQTTLYLSRCWYHGSSYISATTWLEFTFFLAWSGLYVASTFCNFYLYLLAGCG